MPRPKGRPKALNAKAVWFALALGADPKPDAAAQKGLALLWRTVKADQAENGSWLSWPETRPPFFGASDDSMTALATLALLPAAGGELRALERAVWFDYLVLPGDSPLGDEWDARTRYRRVNADDPEPPLRIYRRLR